MKLNLSILILLFPNIVFGQESTILDQEEYKTRLKVSPIQFGQSYFEFTYERMIDQGRKSFSISPMIMLKRNSSEEFQGIQLELQYRIYLKQLNKETHNTWIFSDLDLYSGFYINGLTYNEDYQAGYYDVEQDLFVEEQFNKTIKGAETGVFVGLQLGISKRIVVDFTVGGGVRYTDVMDEFENVPAEYNYNYYDVWDIEYLGVKPRLNLQVGITL